VPVENAILLKDWDLYRKKVKVVIRKIGGELIREIGTAA
jgi:hypothetical protein